LCTYRVAGRWELRGKVTQHHQHRQQRAVAPSLRLWRLVFVPSRLAFLSRQRRSERGEVRLRHFGIFSQQFTRHGLGNDADEGALAAARSA
jgi:hypothetical protein